MAPSKLPGPGAGRQNSRESPQEPSRQSIGQALENLTDKREAIDAWHRGVQHPDVTVLYLAALTHWASCGRDRAIGVTTAIWRHLALITRLADGAQRAGAHLVTGNELRALGQSQAQTIDQIIPLVWTGLAARLGSSLIPPPVHLMTCSLAGGPAKESQPAFPVSIRHRGDVADWQAWQIMDGVLVALLGCADWFRGVREDRCAKLRVCNGCTAVFEASRKDQRHCTLCRSRRPAPALALSRVSPPGPSDPGRQLVWAPTAKGQRVTVRAPIANSGGGQSAWAAVTIGLSTESGDAYAGRADKRGTARDRKRRSRRAI